MHWTYGDIPTSDADLEQGDILLPTPDIRSLFREVHPHFDDPKYLAFIVLTQSCDLVRRGAAKDCSARHISLGVVRSLESVVHHLLAATCATVADGVYVQETKVKAKQLIDRLVDQNEQSMGLFYLHGDVDATGIGDDAVAMLRISIAVRSEHYYRLVAGRRGRLRPEFQAKLGWLIGNLYSRVGTSDWSDHDGGKKSVEALKKRLLDGPYAHDPVWVRDELVQAASQAGVDLKQIPRDDVIAVLSQYEPPSLRESLSRRVAEIASKIMPDLTDDIKVKLKNRVENDGEISSLLRQAARGGSR